MGPIQNACPGKGVRDGVSRFVGLSSFPQTSIICKYWFITTHSNYIRRIWHNLGQRFMFSQKYQMQYSTLARVSISLSQDV